MPEMVVAVLISYPATAVASSKVGPLARPPAELAAMTI